MVKGIINCHSENSRYDSTLKIKDLLETAKEKGYESVALCDTNTLTAIDTFVQAAKEAGIKPIPGIELELQADNTYGIKRRFTLIAKDDIGYQGLFKIITAANRNLDINDNPCVTDEMLNEYFSVNSKYHGHVAATGGGLNGLFGVLLTEPFEYKGQVRALEKELEKYPDEDNPSYQINRKALSDKETLLNSLIEEREELTKTAKRSYKKKENALLKLEGEERAEAERLLNNEKRESKEAVEKLEDIKLKIALTKKHIQEISKRLKDDDELIAKAKGLKKQRDMIQSKILSEEALKTALESQINHYASVFGKEDFYVELQYHGYNAYGFPAEEAVMKTLVQYAKKLGIKMCASNDVHIKDNSPDTLRAFQIIRAINLGRDDKPYMLEPGDKELYLKDEEELKTALLKIADEETVTEAITNTYALCESCNCSFDFGTHYPKFPVPEGKTADELLRDIAYEGIEERFPDKTEWNETYQKRLEYELSVISKMGYSDYFLIVRDFLDFGRKLGKLSEKDWNYLRANIKTLSLDELKSYVDNAEKLPGFGIGAGRGSAAGSLVAYLVGITNIVDPLKYDLLFERFLNPQRVSMPDVDSDLSPDIRDLVVEYCKKLYGVDSVANIMTLQYMAPKGAVKNVGRIMRTEKGSEYRKYFIDLSNEISKKIPFKPGTTFNDCEELLAEEYKDEPSLSPEEKRKRADAREIIRQAKLMEGIFLNYSMHAAGVIIADGHPISDYVALMYDSNSGDMKIQCDMVQAEEVHGLLKFDFLGLKNLRIVTKTLRSIYRRTGENIDVERLPFKDEVFSEIFAKGLTNSVFQFESDGMKDLLKKFKPTCFEDLIALVSLYRPGPMDFIPQYIESKYHPETIHYLCPELKPILGKTYGCIVYQEQVMEIFQKLAGYSLAQADNVRRFMSKKKHDKLAHEKEAFINGDPERGIEGCVAHGISEDTAVKLFDQMYAFASYAFNKSHAAAYAMLSYITAYLKYYYPSDYMAAILDCNDQIDKMPKLISDCKEFGIKVLPPDINNSEKGFTAFDGAVLFGLDSIKSTKENSVAAIIEERNKGPFISFKDFFSRVSIDKTSAENLIKAGAMDSFSSNRFAMLMAYSQSVKPLSIIKEKKKLISELEKMEKTPSVERRISNAEEALKTAILSFNIIKVNDSYPEDFETRMKNEKTYLGFYITAHPLDNFRSPADSGCKTIASLSENDKDVSVMGVIENLVKRVKKGTSNEMAFFDLEDKTGVIRVCCFTKAFRENELILENDKVIKINAFIMNRENEEDPIELSMQSGEELEPDDNEIRLTIHDIFEWNDVIGKIKEKKLEGSNHPLVIYDRTEGLFHPTSFYVKEDILKDKDFDCIPVE